MTTTKKEEQSLKIFKSLYDERKENIVAFSGGKDSIVLYHLAKRTGLKFTYIYSNTTIDPPGHIGFIRKNYPDVQISQPKYTFYEIVERYGLPSKKERFCCRYLKEYVGKNAKVFEGLRIGESVKRGITLNKLKEPESCDRQYKNKIHAYPLMYWTEQEIWEYIKKYKLAYPTQYDLGFRRLGCVGCPQATIEERIRQYKIYPKYVYTIIKAIDKNLKRENKTRLSRSFSDPYEAFCWWISELPVRIFKKPKIFEIDYKENVEQLFPLKKKPTNY
jgi:phosphoadenosine phosphosulfate reductase